MTTETLKEADRYLLNNGFTCRKLTDLGGQHQASYEFGQIKTKTGSGITITLHDYGDGHWTDTLVGASDDLLGRAQQIMDALDRLPGFEPHRI
jgi:hypothetical protein